MLQSFHQCSEQFEILFNKKRYDALSTELKSMIDYAVQAASADMSWKAIDRYSKDYGEMQKAGVKFWKTPDAILKSQLAAWDKILDAKGARNPMFKKVSTNRCATSPSGRQAGRTTPWSITRWPTTIFFAAKK